MSGFGSFSPRRLAAIGAAVALGSGVASVGVLSTAVPPAEAIIARFCPSGQVVHFLKAVTTAGVIQGKFCVNPIIGVGTYTQFTVGTSPSVSGTGVVQEGIGSIRIAAFGDNLSLAGQASGPTNHFVEFAPVTAIGEFNLS